jgi:predicted NAD-dependent protein-ADP-ribosyltransferase YbiA (DUF1768 family)
MGWNFGRMIVRLREGLLVVTPEAGEAEGLSAWLAAYPEHVFRLSAIKGGSALLQSLGPEPDACREPINITSRTPGALGLISNFAATDFVLDGAAYASIEGFWQGLKFPDGADRRRLAALHGSAARDAGYDAPEADVFVHGGQSVRVGTFDHWQLMQKACAAKFEQHAAARAALLSTRERPLVHRVKRDSKNIPGVIMAAIWMRLRARLARAGSEEAIEEAAEA